MDWPHLGEKLEPRLHYTRSPQQPLTAELLCGDYLPRTFTFLFGGGERGQKEEKMFTFPSVRNLKQTILALRKLGLGFTDVDFNG